MFNILSLGIPLYEPKPLSEAILPYYFL